MFTRRYFAEGKVFIEIDGEKFKVSNDSIGEFFEGVYKVEGTHKLTVKANGDTVNFQRVNSFADPENQLVGKWKSEVNFLGENLEVVLQIDREKNVSYFIEANDEGIFSTNNGKLELVSKWASTILVGHYKTLENSDMEISLWPYDTVKLVRQ